MTTRLLMWLHKDDGASMVEYAILVVLIAIVALVAVRFMGQETSTLYSEISSDLAGASPG
jgi:pilus assembly protein Flp/PilA